MHFLGFLVMENKLKPVTTEVIQKLAECEVTTIMATGDNILTAISIARQCELVKRDTEIVIGDLEPKVKG